MSRAPFALVLLLATSSAAAETLNTIEPAYRARTIDGVLQLLRENYVFPEKAVAMDEAIRARVAAGEYDDVTSGHDLAGRLTDHLREVCQDLHLRVRFSPESHPIPTDERAEPSEAEREARRTASARRNHGFMKVERLAGNVGYLKLDGFVDVELGRETATAAMSFLGHTDAILIDLRENGGGSPEMVQWISSYLFGDEPVHLNSLYFRPDDRTTEFWTLPDVPGPKNPDALVYVLTSSYTFSAAEEFTYNLKCRGRARIVGETSGGGAHPGGAQPVDDHFAVWVPTGRAINPITNTNWEGTGVPVDLDAPAWAAKQTAYLDALEKLREGAVDHERKQELLEAIRGANRELADLEIAHEAEGEG